MKFFRDNMFVVTLVTVTIAVSAVLVWLGYSKSGDTETVQMEPREQVARKLSRLSRPPFENPTTIRNQQQRVDMILTSLKEVQDMNLKFNNKNFDVPLLPTVGGAEVAALPYDELTWNKRGLAFRYTQKYHTKIDALLKTLKATAPPTADEVSAEAQMVLDRLEYEKMIKDKKQSAGTATEAPTRAAGFPAGPAGAPMAAPRGAGGTASDLQSEAKEKALNIMRLRKAQRGVIYAKESALDVKFLRGKMYTASEITPDGLWDAQVGLWVQRDVISAIGETINEVMDKRGLKGDQRNVMNSPVKQLVEFRLGETDRSAVSAGGRQPGGMMGAPGPGGPGYGGAPYGGASRNYGNRGKDEVAKADSLTQHAANKMFDVANYRFVVLMPTRYLPILERNLLKQNYHVILNENIQPADFAASEKRNVGGRNDQVDEASLYYFGTEPVSRVTIEGQLLMLTSWTRGTWDSENRKWIRLPLMPIEVMQTLSPSALRKEDQDLLKQAAKLKAKEKLDDRLPTLPWANASGSVSSR